MELTIEGIAFTFTHIEETWSAAAVVDYINFTAADIKFAPLKTTTTRQIEALLKMPATLKRSDKCLLLAFYVEVLDQNVIVQLDRETLTENEELHVMIRKQQARIDQLEQRIARLDPATKFFRAKIWLRSDRISFEADHKEDEQYLQQFLDLWWNYMENRYCVENGYELYSGSYLTRAEPANKRNKIGIVFKNFRHLTNRESCIYRTNNGDYYPIDIIRDVPNVLAAIYQMKRITYNYARIEEAAISGRRDSLSLIAGCIPKSKKDQLLGFIHLRRVPLKHQFVPKEEATASATAEAETSDAYPIVYEWNENESLIIYRPALT